MAFVLADRVKETSTTAGTGTFTLAGAVTGFQSFSAVGNGNSTFYCIASQSLSEWEVGVGTYTSSGTTLSRDTVLSSSSGGSKVSFSAGTKDVFVTYPSEVNVVSPVVENEQTISYSYSLQSGRNGQSVGPVTVSTGASVTVGTGQKWLVWGI